VGINSKVNIIKGKLKGLRVQGVQQSYVQQSCTSEKPLVV
jgi:hypothetical protein